jgi:predicted metallo-beta-lactamase superfamily hydrolase
MQIDLQHHSCRLAGNVQRFVNLVDVRFVRHFHRDDFDPVRGGT